MGHLELQSEPVGLRHYLDGRPVHPGACLERRRTDGTWEAGRYEWAFQADAKPMFYTGCDEQGNHLWADLEDSDVLRWPQ